MHSALLITELLDSILDYLAEDTAPQRGSSRIKDTYGPGRKALAALASTSRALSEPALDALWRRLYSLTPFLSSVPTEASYHDASLGAALPPFNEEEWRRVLRYATRVQVLALEKDDLSRQILQSLWFRTTLLLPNLRRLHWLYEDHAALTSIRLLLGPSLVHLNMWLRNDNHTSVSAFLETCHAFCPDLISLRFHNTDDATAVVSLAISRFPNLEVFDCDYIDHETLLLVSQSRRLQKFTSSFFHHQPHGLEQIASYATPDYSPFQNLRFLELRLADLCSFIPCLKAHYQPFEEVSLEIYSFTPPDVFHDFFSALSSVTRRQTLRHITLSVVFSLEKAMSCDGFVDFDALSPLASLNLRSFDMSVKLPVSLNDDDFVRLVQGWSLLERFHLNDMGGWYLLPSFQFPTLRGLVHLLARCPKLYELGMSFDARSIPSLSDEEASICNLAITRLSVACSPIEGSVAGVARFLHEHLPSLVEVSPWAHPRMWLKVDAEHMQLNSLSLKSRWRKVARHIRHIRGHECSGSD